jgi:hypothetical protein
MPSIARAASLSLLVCALTGCAVVTVAGAVVGVAAAGAGLAVDATVGTVKAVGAVGSAVLPGGGQDQK